MPSFPCLKPYLYFECVCYVAKRRGEKIKKKKQAFLQHCCALFTDTSLAKSAAASEDSVPKQSVKCFEIKIIR